MPVSDSIKKDFRRIFQILAFLLAISYGASLLAYFHWTLDLLSHFTIQYMIGILILLPLGLHLRLRKTVMLLLVTGVFCSAEIIPLLQFSKLETSGGKITVMQYNRHASQLTHDDLKDLLFVTEPDIAILQEANPSLAKMTESIRELYPHQIIKLNRHHPFLPYPLGMIILSRFPLNDTMIHEFDDLNVENNFIRTVINMPDQSGQIVLYAMHPKMPMGTENWSERNAELKTMSSVIKNDKSPYILFVGDLNTSPFSPFLRRLIKTTKLNLSYMAGPIPTWPSFHKFSLFQISIDHILFSEKLHLTDQKRLQPMGSDHYPILAKFSVIP